MTDEEFTRHVLKASMRELRADSFARLLRLNRSGSGD